MFSSISPLSDVMLALKDHSHKLTPKDKVFADSLLLSYVKYKNLTPKQIPFAIKLANCAVHGYPAPFKKLEAIAGFLPIVVFFAKSKVKYPSIELDLTKDVSLGLVSEALVLKKAGPKSKFNGGVTLSDGVAYPQGKFFGHIDPLGVFHPSNGGDVFSGLLNEFAKDPVIFVSNMGKLTGKCVFCNIALTDPASIHWGYGAKCAQNHGLPYSKSSAPYPGLKINLDVASLPDLGGGLGVSSNGYAKVNVASLYKNGEFLMEPLAGYKEITEGIHDSVVVTHPAVEQPKLIRREKAVPKPFLRKHDYLF